VASVLAEAANSHNSLLSVHHPRVLCGSYFCGLPFGFHPGERAINDRISDGSCTDIVPSHRGSTPMLELAAIEEKGVPHDESVSDNEHMSGICVHQRAQATRMRD
jgi:hypothetical protein